MNKKSPYSCPFCGNNHTQSRPTGEGPRVGVTAGMQTWCRQCSARGPAAERADGSTYVLWVWAMVSQRVHK